MRDILTVSESILDESRGWESDIPPSWGIRVSYQEQNIRSMIKSAGAKWNPEKQLWELPYHHIQSLGLTRRIKKE